MLEHHAHAGPQSRHVGGALADVDPIDQQRSAIERLEAIYAFDQNALPGA